MLKGVVHKGENIIRNYIGVADSSEIEEVESEFLPYSLHGTGDLFASGVTAAIYAGRSLYEAVFFAGNLVGDAMRVTPAQPNFEIRGVCFEPVLSGVTNLLG